MSTHISEVAGGPLKANESIFEFFEDTLINNADEPAAIVMFQPADHLSGLVSTVHKPVRNGELKNGQVALNGHSSHGKVQGECLSWTYRDLHLASVRFTNALLKAGIQSENSKIMSLLPAGIEFALLQWTSMLARTTLCNLDMGALEPKRRAELENFLVSLAPDVVLVPDTAGARAIDATLAAQSLPQPKVKLIAPASNAAVEVPLGWQTLSDFVVCDLSTPLKDDETLRKEAKSVNPNHAALILFTSGTSSGKPKGCIRTVRQVCYTFSGQTWLTPRGKDTRCFLAGANFRAMCNTFILQTWHQAGAAVIPYINFSPEMTLQAIEQHRIDSMLMVPCHFHSIIDHPRFKSTDVSSVRLVASGGDMITKDFLTKLKIAFPQAENIRPGHGMTEGGALFRWPYGNDVNNFPYFGGISPLGTVEDGVRMRVVDESTGIVTKRGEPGELHVLSPSFTTEYYGGVRKEDWYVDDHGKWFKTGDLGMIAEDESIYILGRIKDIIKRAGIPITPAALENCIENYTKCPSSVIGLTHPTLGTEPFAVVQNFDFANEEEVKRAVLDEFGKDYALGGVVSLQQIGLKEFPLNATAKIMKIELVQPVLDYFKKNRHST